MYTKLYYNADSQMLIDQIFEEITLLQGRNLRGVWGGGVTPPKIRIIRSGRANHLDWHFGKNSGQK